MVKSLFRSTMRHPKNMSFEGADNDEQILYIFRRSFITNFDWMFVAIILLLTPLVANTILAFASEETKQVIPPLLAFILNTFWYIFIFGYCLQNFINWYYNVYIITSKRIIDIDFIGILYKNISEAPILNVEDVTSTVTGALRMTFNYGSVYIQTAGETREFEFTDVANPSEVRDIVSDIVTDAKTRRGGRT